jgi:myo-inositol-1(or 4)-monophosphatase
MAEPNLQEIHDLLMDLARRAGEMMTSATPTAGTVDTKKNCKQSPPPSNPERI